MIYYLKQDNTVWGCGESGCCGEYYEEISDSFVDCNHEIEIGAEAEHLHGCNGGGPVLEWRTAYALESQAYEDGKSEGWSDGADWGEKHQIERIIKLLEPLGECEPSICGMGCRGEYRCIGWAYRHAIRLIKGEK